MEKTFLKYDNLLDRKIDRILLGKSTFLPVLSEEALIQINGNNCGSQTLLSLIKREIHLRREKRRAQATPTIKRTHSFYPLKRNEPVHLPQTGVYLNYDNNNLNKFHNKVHCDTDDYNYSVGSACDMV
jgi:hypothetical protein